MNVKKILLATDFSDQSDAALQMATALARDSGATLLIAHTVELAPVGADRGFGGYVAEGEVAEIARVQLEALAPSDSRVGYSHKLLEGAPAEAIVQYADEEGADLIVIGSHGRTGFTRLLLGSVAEAVVRHAKCPVLTVKHPSAATESDESDSE